MKKRNFWKILLGVVVAVVVLGAIGFGFLRYRMWGGHFGEYGKMPHDYDGVMPCEEGGEAASEGCGFMHQGGMRGYGMGRMPHMRGMPGMYGSWGHRGFSPLTNLLLLGLIIFGVMHFTRYRRYHKFYHHGPMHMHPGHHPAEGTCCCGDESEDVASTPNADENQPESE